MIHLVQSTKPLLKWMDDGDPELVPVVMADARATAASYFQAPVRAEGTSASFIEREESPITPGMVVRCACELGVHFHCSLGSITPLDIIEFMDTVEMDVREECGPVGEMRKFTTIRTPAGDLSDVFVTPYGEPAYWLEHLVKTDADLPALAYLIEKSAELSVGDERVRAKLTGKLRSEAAKWPGNVPLYTVMGIPAFMLSCNLFVDATTAFYLMADHEPLMEGLYAAYEECNSVWVECAAAAGADFVLGAINGLELFSPDIYNRYFVPQARHLHDQAHRLGMRGWTHTCGQMGRLIDTGVYEATGVDVLESLSSPPLGDVADLRTARARLGKRIVTRGAVNVEMFYENDAEQLKTRTQQVLDETRGYRHMIGDTNDSFPPYPRESILSIVDEVRGSGRMLPFEL